MVPKRVVPPSDDAYARKPFSVAEDLERVTVYAVPPSYWLELIAGTEVNS